jgi:hypothetical protein
MKAARVAVRICNLIAKLRAIVSQRLLPGFFE